MAVPVRSAGMAWLGGHRKVSRVRMGARVMEEVAAKARAEWIRMRWRPGRRSWRRRRRSFHR